MLIGLMIGFLILGLGLASYEAHKRRWLDAARHLGATAVAVAGYAAILLHKPWIGMAALPVAVTAAVAYIAIARSQARKAAAADKA
ncbi:hypothetical protein ACFQ6N_17270 [Kitasatospora sp. NPDC056446]|uniref:hypothetical protein n=1 Tax=Kitasatospora sp. NPDC056446 TaxID=3345819 RepID=UPI0036CE31EF